MAELPPGGEFARRTAWVPGFFISLLVWFGFLVLPLFLFFAAPGLALLMGYTVMPWTGWAYPFLLLSSAPILGMLLTLVQIFIVSAVFGRVTAARGRGEQFLIAIALFAIVMIVMKFLGPHLGLTMPRVRM
ncbi:MAG TPA: hypothetical protein VFS58_15995 [Steroidobacteraceae bacterium]|nr:hypothetical protein [Steroidobacteraceae bacterium]